MSDDPWAHRSKGMRCETCMWFVFKATENEKPVHLGRCRKNAPTMKGFVPVFGTDWCGEHRLDENRV